MKALSSLAAVMAIPQSGGQHQRLMQTLSKPLRLLVIVTSVCSCLLSCVAASSMLVPETGKGAKCLN